MSIIFTAIVVGGLMYAIITGLAYNVIKKTAENLKVIDVEEQPPPPEDRELRHRLRHLSRKRPRAVVRAMSEATASPAAIAARTMGSNTGHEDRTVLP